MTVALVNTLFLCIIIFLIHQARKFDLLDDIQITNTKNIEIKNTLSISFES